MKLFFLSSLLVLSKVAAVPYPVDFDLDSAEIQTISAPFGQGDLVDISMLSLTTAPAVSGVVTGEVNHQFLHVLFFSNPTCTSDGSCDLASSGVGKTNAEGFQVICCNEAAKNQNLCSDVGKLVLDSSFNGEELVIPVPATVDTAFSIPTSGGAFTTTVSDTHLLLAANCLEGGLTVKIQGAFEWATAP